MTPFCFEWQWNIEYLIFMGLLYIALGIIGCGLIVVWVKTWLDLDREDEQDEVPPKIHYRTKYSEY